MSGSGAIDGNHVHRSGALCCIIQAHRFGELGPGGTVDKGVTMPSAKITSGVWDWSAGGLHGGLGSEMLDHGIVPILAVLMAQDDVVSRHGSIWTLFLR